LGAAQGQTPGDPQVIYPSVRRSLSSIAISLAKIAQHLEPANAAPAVQEAEGWGAAPTSGRPLPPKGLEFLTMSTDERRLLRSLGGIPGDRVIFSNDVDTLEAAEKLALAGYVESSPAGSSDVYVRLTDKGHELLADSFGYHWMW
jgi:hypothetical protein